MSWYLRVCVPSEDSEQFSHPRFDLRRITEFLTARCASSHNSDQTARMRSLIRVVAGRKVDSQESKVSPADELCSYLVAHIFERLMRNRSLVLDIHYICIGHREPIVTGLLIGAKKCREAWGSYFVEGGLWLVNNKDELKLIILIWRKKCLFVIFWLFQRNKCFCVCLLEPKEEVGKLQSFKFWYLSIEGLLHSASKKSLKVLVMVVFFLVYFAMLSLGFELKQNLEALPYPEMNP